MPTLAFVIAVAATFFSVGITWFMQLTEYPLFRHVGPSEFDAFHAAHNRGLPAAVFLPVVVAIAATATLLRWRPAAIPAGAVWASLALLAGVMLSTATLQAPLHVRLDREGYSRAVIDRLVRVNWLRTALWTLDGAVVAWMLVSTLAG